MRMFLGLALLGFMAWGIYKLLDLFSDKTKPPYTGLEPKGVRKIGIVAGLLGGEAKDIFTGKYLLKRVDKH